MAIHEARVVAQEAKIGSRSRASTKVISSRTLKERMGNGMGTVDPFTCSLWR